MAQDITNSFALLYTIKNSLAKSLNAWLLRSFHKDQQISAKTSLQICLSVAENAEFLQLAGREGE